MEEDITRVPDGWPANWQHLVLLKKICQEITEVEAELAASQKKMSKLTDFAQLLTEWFRAGDVYFGVSAALRT